MLSLVSFFLPLTLFFLSLLTRELLNLTFALHWYEWQQGPSPLPQDRYRFDTHYPDYLPARTDFQSVVTELQDDGVFIFPYINGRIFDINSTSYLTENGGAACCMYPAPVFGGATNLTYYNETYGSNATFHPADPSTPYWQGKISEVVSALVTGYGTEGVYIDQLSAAGPTPDWSPNHNHTLGGGTWWAAGINQLIATSRNNITVGAPLVTEGNAEPYMANINGYASVCIACIYLHPQYVVF